MLKTPYKSYIICTSPRSGSTLLCKLLGATKKAGAPDSHFHTPSLATWLKTYKLDNKAFASELDTLQAIFAAALQRGTADTGMFGLRMQRGSFKFFMQQLANLYPDETNDVARIEAAFGKTLFIHLTRPDKLDQAISLVKATQTGLWHQAADGSELQRLSAPQEPFYDSAEIARQIAELSALELEWLNWFEQEDLHPLQISYDELSSNPAGKLEAVLDALGLDRDFSRGIKPPVKKLADSTNLDWADRYRGERLS